MKKLLTDKRTARSFLLIGVVFIVLLPSLIVLRDWASRNDQYDKLLTVQRPQGEHFPVKISAENRIPLLVLDVIKESAVLIFGLALSTSLVYLIFRRLVYKILGQNQFLRTVIESLSYPFCVIDANDYTVEFANSSAIPGGLQGQSKCYEAMCFRHRPCEDSGTLCTVTEVKKSKQPASFERMHTDQDGRCRYVEIHGCPIFDNDGNITRVIEYAIDITDRKMAEQITRESEQRIATILGSLSSGIIIIDAESHQVLDVNPAAADMVGLSKAQIVGRVCHHFLCPSSKGGCPVTDLSECVNRSERILLKADGSQIPVLKTATVVEINGRACIVENFFDLTVQKETEKALRDSREQAENAVRMKSRFLANMSHEIRTPMNSIIGFADLLDDEDLTDEQRDYLGMIVGNGKQLLQLINDILDFSKIEAGKLSISPRPCSPTKILSEVEAMVAPFVSKKDLAFEILKSGDLPETIVTDEARLKQCLINLISNAIKFTNVGGVCVHVKTERVRNHSYIRFNVEDTGVGISPDKQDKIFDSFTQADDSTTRRYGGTGLGLAITRQLSELLGGSLTLSSQEGVGSVFSLEVSMELEAAVPESFSQNS